MRDGSAAKLRSCPPHTDRQQCFLHWQQAFTAGLGAAGAVGLAVGGFAYAAMWPASQIFGRTLIAPRRPGELALTFDDGPNPAWTPRLLDILATHEVHATSSWWAGLRRLSRNWCGASPPLAT